MPTDGSLRQPDDENAFDENDEEKWKPNMTKNAAIKMGLEALKDSLEDDLNNDTVEIALVDSDGYHKMGHAETMKHLEKLN